MVGRRARRGQPLVTPPVPSEKTGGPATPRPPPTNTVAPRVWFSSQGTAPSSLPGGSHSRTADTYSPASSASLGSGLASGPDGGGVLGFGSSEACMGLGGLASLKFRVARGLDGGCWGPLNFSEPRSPPPHRSVSQGCVRDAEVTCVNMFCELACGHERQGSWQCGHLGLRHRPVWLERRQAAARGFWGRAVPAAGSSGVPSGVVRVRECPGVRPTALAG